MRSFSGTTALALLLSLLAAIPRSSAAPATETTAAPAEPSAGKQPAEKPPPPNYYLMLGVSALVTALLGGAAGLITASRKMGDYQKSDSEAFIEGMKLALTNEKGSVELWRLLEERLVSTTRVETALRLLLTNAKASEDVWALLTAHLYGKKRPELLEAVLIQLFTNPDKVAALAGLMGSSLTKVTAQLPADLRTADLSEVKEVVRSAMVVGADAPPMEIKGKQDD